MTDRTPVVLALLADALQARAADNPDGHDLHALADGVALAVDHGAAAALWPTNEQDNERALWLLEGLDGADNGPSPTEVAVARRLADVAASLRVRGEPMRREAEVLWGAASRLLGLEEKTVADLDPSFEAAMAWRHWALGMSPAAAPHTDDATIRDLVRSSLQATDTAHVIERAAANTLRLDLASMTEQRDEALRQLADLRREMAGVFRR